MESDYITSLSDNSFLIDKNENISENVKTTYDFVIDNFTANFDKIIAACDNNQQSKDGLRFFLDGWKKLKNWYSEGKIGYGVFVASKVQ